MTSSLLLTSLPLPGAGDTVALGRALGRKLFPGAVVALTGPLGAGKTTLVRGIAEGMGLEEGYTVSSPTYTILQAYPCRDRRLFHLDLYRVSGPEDLESTGWRDALAGEDVLVVEWPEREPQMLPREHLLLQLDYLEGEGRMAQLLPCGETWCRVAEELAREMRG